MTAPIRREHRNGSAGQSLVEFTMILPVFLLILFGMVEFGFVFTHNLTLEYATREGARTGAALADGGGNATTCASIDPQIVAAVQRVLKSPGSPIDISRVSQIQIWKAATPGGTPITGFVNTWTYTGAATGPIVDGQRLDFTEQSQQWAPCTRDNGSSPDSVGVSLVYTYRLVTPLAAVTQFFGGPSASTLGMNDRTVMALNP